MRSWSLVSSTWVPLTNPTDPSKLYMCVCTCTSIIWLSLYVHLSGLLYYILHYLIFSYTLLSYTPIHTLTLIIHIYAPTLCSFFTIENGKRLATPLFLCLVCVELSDVLFAFDSVPAIFGITTDSFIVFTSNM